MNKTKIKNRRKSKTRNRTKKFKGGFLASLSSMFGSSKVSENFKEFLKNKNISDDIQKVYDAKNKEESTFNTALSTLKGKMTKLTELIREIENEQTAEYNNKSTKNPLLGNSYKEPAKTNPNAAQPNAVQMNARQIPNPAKPNPPTKI
uniref:Uncharacterized protein n=1 Tax=viral metagenome TaxID=1070528 RepID=A0A6C0D3F8_9ZZZZ